MKIYAISDIHVDYPDNLTWISQLSLTHYQEDALILAGDVTHDLTLLKKTLQLLKQRFQSVLFVPGNHELWLKEGEFHHSLDKFHAIVSCCDQLGVHTSALSLPQDPPITIIPIFSWYSRPEDGPDSLYWPKHNDDPSLAMWNDTHLVKWPTIINHPASYFLALNTPPDQKHLTASTQVITFSHFLPRQELMYVYHQRIHTDRLSCFNFSRVAGSNQIDQLIRKLGTKLHVYGHHHRNQLKKIDGINYVSACLGYPREQRSRAVWALEEKGPLLIWSAKHGFLH